MLRPGVALVLVALALPAAASGQTSEPAPEPPAVTTDPAQAVTQTTATLVARITPRGAPTTVRFEYGTSTAYGLETAERSIAADAGQTLVRVALTGLSAATTYAFRAVAVNAAGRTEGANRTLRTASPPAAARPPSVSTGPATGVGATAVTLTAAVRPNGQPTTTRFEYGASASRLDFRTPEQPAGAGSAAVTVSAPVGALAPNRRIFYRVVATSPAGVARGRTRSVTTRRALGGLSFVLEPATVAFGGATRVGGRLTGSGVGGVPVVLEGDDFPFGDGFRVLAQTRTASGGTFSMQSPALFSANRLRVVTRTTPVVVSPVQTVANRLSVGLLVPRRSGSRGLRLVAFRGRVFPNRSGDRVSLQRRTGSGRWIPVRRSVVRRVDGVARYALRARVPRAGAAFRVVVTPEPGGPHVRGISRERTVRLR